MVWAWAITIFQPAVMGRFFQVHSTELFTNRYTLHQPSWGKNMNKSWRIYPLTHDYQIQFCIV